MEIDIHLISINGNGFKVNEKGLMGSRINILFKIGLFHRRIRNKILEPKGNNNILFSED